MVWGLCPGERVRARELWAFLLRGGGREGGSLEWCAGAYFYIPKTTVAVDPLRLQSIYCTHQCVGLSRVCARRGSAWQHRGAQGLSRRSGSAWTPPFAQGCALGKPPCHTSVCTQHQVARSQAQEGAPLLAGCARLTLPWGQHARVCDGSIVRVDFHPRRGLRRLGHVTMSRECDCRSVAVGWSCCIASCCLPGVDAGVSRREVRSSPSPERAALVGVDAPLASSPPGGSALCRSLDALHLRATGVGRRESSARVSRGHEVLDS